jgi:AAA domain
VTEAGTTKGGRIVSFYSFKGGVGRTMALANVAFLAALNGMRVLVMDWDLEAPGLHHYFRGLLEPDEMADLRSAPGILDLAWAWRTGIDRATDPAEIDRQFERFRNGEPFVLVRRSVWNDEFEEGCLDIIPAGGDMIETPDLVEYERALAAMSWNELLDRYAGGGLIEALRQWAAQNYDLILVDSRTGLADVAGICTMQIPDSVVLSFVLNRQNIEGVARVASAIRRNRGDELKIWAVPMRVSREGTDEEADASARALRELTRPGRLDREATEHDLKNLLIKAEPDVPFMESLSVFSVTNAALDPLTANMARLAAEITGREIDVPVIADNWRELFSSRLAPTLSTDAYLRQLLTAEPERATRQLHGYVESAISTFVEGDELADDYVAALADTAIAFEQRNDLDPSVDRSDVIGRTIVLLRKVHDRNPAIWRQRLVAALETSLNSDLSWLGPQDEALALDEIDELLAAEPQTIQILDRRVETRMRAARSYEIIPDPLQLLSNSEETLALIKVAMKTPGSETAEWQIRRLDTMLLRASALEDLDQPDDAVESLHRIIKSVRSSGLMEGSESLRFIFEANFRLMRLVQKIGGGAEEASRFALDVIRAATPNAPVFLSRIPDLADVILTSPKPGRSAAELLRKAVNPPAEPKAFSQLFGRAASGGGRVIGAFANLLIAGSEALAEEERAPLALATAEVVRYTAKASFERTLQFSRRSSLTRRQPSLMPSTLIQSVRRFTEAATAFPTNPELSATLEELRVIVTSFEHRVLEVETSQKARSRKES